MNQDQLQFSLDTSGDLEIKANLDGLRRFAEVLQELITGVESGQRRELLLFTNDWVGKASLTPDWLRQNESRHSISTTLHDPNHVAIKCVRIEATSTLSRLSQGADQILNLLEKMKSSPNDDLIATIEDLETGRWMQVIGSGLGIATVIPLETKNLDAIERARIYFAGVGGEVDEDESSISFWVNCEGDTRFAARMVTHVFELVFRISNKQPLKVSFDPPDEFINE